MHENVGHNLEPEMVLDLVQGLMPNHLRRHIPNYQSVREEQAYTLTHVGEYEDLYQEYGVQKVQASYAPSSH